MRVITELSKTEGVDKVFSAVWLWGITGAQASARMEPSGMSQIRINMGEPVKVVMAPAAAMNTIIAKTLASAPLSLSVSRSQLPDRIFRERERLV